MGVTVRPAEAGDAAAVADIHVETWQAAYPGLVPQHVLDGLSRRRQTRRWQRAIRDPASELGQVFVAEDREIAGFGSALRESGEITTLYVRPAAQRRGVGRRLLCHMTEYLGGPVSLWVLDGNPAAGYYARLGGVPGVRRTVERWGLQLGQTEYRWSVREDGISRRLPR